MESLPVILNILDKHVSFVYFAVWRIQSFSFKGYFYKFIQVFVKSLFGKTGKSVSMYFFLPFED